MADKRIRKYKNRVGFYKGDALTGRFWTITIPEFDPDAEAFITVTGILGIQATAINDLVIGLKNVGIWSKMVAVYPMVGGTASTHKYNLMDPRDANDAYRLDFVGTWDHTANGAKPVTGGANTFMRGHIDLIQNNRHLSHYSTTDTLTIGYEWGGGGGFENVLIQRYSNSNAYIGFGQYVLTPVSDSLGFLYGQILSGTYRLWKNGSEITTTAGSDNDVGRYMSLGNDNRAFFPDFDASTFELSTKNCAFASAGEALTTQEMEDFYDIVQDYQTALGRNV
jgi:hypothetical protein